MIMVAVPSRDTKALVEPCEIVAHHTALQLRSFALVYFYTRPWPFACSASAKEPCAALPPLGGSRSSQAPGVHLLSKRIRVAGPVHWRLASVARAKSPAGPPVGWRSPEGGHPSTTRPLRGGPTAPGRVCCLGGSFPSVYMPKASYFPYLLLKHAPPASTERASTRSYSTLGHLNNLSALVDTSPFVPF